MTKGVVIAQTVYNNNPFRFAGVKHVSFHDPALIMIHISVSIVRISKKFSILNIILINVCFHLLSVKDGKISVAKSKFSGKIDAPGTVGPVGKFVHQPDGPVISGMKIEKKGQV